MLGLSPVLGQKVRASAPERCSSRAPGRSWRNRSGGNAEMGLMDLELGLSTFASISRPYYPVSTYPVTLDWWERHLVAMVVVDRHAVVSRNTAMMGWEWRRCWPRCLGVCGCSSAFTIGVVYPSSCCFSCSSPLPMGVLLSSATTSRRRTRFLEDGHVAQ